MRGQAGSQTWLMDSRRDCGGQPGGPARRGVPGGGPRLGQCTGVDGYSCTWLACGVSTLGRTQRRAALAVHEEKPQGDST